MRTFLSGLLIILLSFGLFINEASAKRFGGGRSFGVQRSHSSLFSSQSSYKSAAMNKVTNKSRWGGILGGLLVGGLLTSLFMGHGLANGLMTWLILGAVLFFIVSFVRSRMQPNMATNNRSTPFSNFTQAFAQSNQSSNSASEYPANFVPEQFLRDAKIMFIRLQTAYDQKNLQDLNAFTAPEVFAEIKMQLEERGDAFNKTEVIHLEAELLDVSRQALSTMASVRFTGSIKENNEPTTQLDEIWHFRQFSNNAGWVVGGIQQEVFQP